MKGQEINLTFNSWKVEPFHFTSSDITGCPVN